MFICCGLAALLVAAGATLFGARPAPDAEVCCRVKARARRARLAPAAIAATSVLLSTLGLAAMLHAQSAQANGEAIAASLCPGAILSSALLSR